MPTLLAWPSRKVWQSLEKKQLNARGVNIKLKLKNFQTLQHSKSFKNPIHSQQDLIQVLFLLLNEMHIPENFQFRLIGIEFINYRPKLTTFNCHYGKCCFFIQKNNF